MRKESEDEGNQLKNLTPKYLNKKSLNPSQRLIINFLSFCANCSRTQLRPCRFCFDTTRMLVSRTHCILKHGFLFQLKKKKLEQRSKLENLEDLEIIIQLKKRKKYRKTKVPVVKEPEPKIIVRAAWFCSITPRHQATGE